MIYIDRKIIYKRNKKQNLKLFHFLRWGVLA